MLTPIFSCSNCYIDENYDEKSKEIIQTGKGAICFYWKSLNRQVRLVGNLDKVSDEVSDKYYQFNSQLLTIHHPVFLDGYWQNELYFSLHSKHLLKEVNE